MLTMKAWLEGVQERKGEELEVASKNHRFKEFCCNRKETLII